jgi:predicted Zn-dependent protease
MKKLALGLALLLATACATAPKNSLRETAEPQAGIEPRTLDFEQKLSAEILPELLKVYPPVEDLAVQEYVAGLGNKLLSADVYNGQVPPYQWNFTVVKSAQPETFSLPAGEVFISSALMAQAENEGRVADAVAREIVHVVLKHTTMRIQELRQLNKNWSMVGGGLIGASMGYGMGKVQEDPSNGARKWAFLKPTLQQERETEELALAITAKAGYHPGLISGNNFEKVRSKAKALAKTKGKG